jgi:hypothetical protein
MRSNARLPRARTSDFVVRELEDETLVYDMQRDRAHCLNRTAAVVWKHCDGNTTATEAVRSLNSAFSFKVDEDVVWLAVKQLERFHMVDEPKNLPIVSRRDLVLKYAPVALALPVIMSITAPTPAGTATCGGQGAPCSTNLDCCPGCSCDGICFCGGA